MFIVKDTKSLRNFVGYVILYAPNSFRREDFLTDDQQMTLEKAFDVIRAGIDKLNLDFPKDGGFVDLNRILAESLNAYRSGDEVKGAHLIHEFRELALKRFS